MKRSTASKVMMFLVVGFLLDGYFVCATANESEKALWKKVDLVWKAKVRGDWGAVYDMASSDYKKLVKRNEFLGGSRPTIVDFSVKEVKLDETKKKAQVTVDYRLEWMATKFDATAQDDWLIEKGKWVIDLFPESSMKKAFPGSS